MTEENKEKTPLLKQIRDEVVKLSASPLYSERVKNKVFPVIGEGSHDACIMFVGEAPGRNEAATGRPFCGAAGKLLDEMLASINIPRTDVYITNIVKDRPTENRDPTPQEIEIYAPFLDRQIDIIQPKVIATLGRFSMAYLFNKFGLEFELEPISRIHGKTFKAAVSYGDITIIPLYHPAVAIYNIHMKETLFKDFEILKKYHLDASQ
ncbi:MAG: uracil-DNA glycosylase [Patescibacteria group bacterium]|nr:uracil-DNA glycosylase [bacterium]MDZ4241177.1 uracil-DNA glycosylase [Patescibacteria group bacterium]